jgi:hypothetical protein
MVNAIDGTKKEEWVMAMTTWLQGFSWQWFATLTFRPGFSEPQARWRLRHWVGELRDALGTPDFQWIGVPESGRTGLDFHFHVLVGGLRKWHSPERMIWMRKWRKLAGEARISIFKKDAGGIEYLLKHARPENADALEIHLTSRSSRERDTK